MVAKAALGVVVNVTGFQESLAGNAPDAKAGAAKFRIFVNAGRVHAQLSCPNCSNVSPRTTAQNHYIVLNSLHELSRFSCSFSNLS
jgi:hypothetical protein